MANARSSNLGGARPGAGRKRGGFNRLAKDAIDKANAAPVHPLDFLLLMVADEGLTMKERGAAAQACLPYCQSKLSYSELNVNSVTDGMTNKQIVARLTGNLDQLGLLPDTRLINGSAERVAVVSQDDSNDAA
jgi:hypothetical protein